MRIKEKNLSQNMKIEPKPSRKFNSINYPEPVIEPYTAKNNPQKLSLNQMQFSSRHNYEKIKNEYDQLEYPGSKAITSKNVKPISTNRSNSNLMSQQSGTTSSRKFRQTHSQQHIEVLGSKHHLKDKLNRDVLCFFDQHRKSAVLVGNSKYKDKSPEHYLHDYFENDPQYYDDLDKQKTINKSMNFNEESNLNETFQPHHYNYQEIYDRNHGNCHHIQSFKPSELKLAPSTSTQRLLQERREKQDIYPGSRTALNHNHSLSNNFVFLDQNPNQQPTSPVSYYRSINNDSYRAQEEVNSSKHIDKSKRILLKPGHGKCSSVQLNNGSPSHYNIGSRSPGSNIKSFYNEKNSKETITRVKSNIISDETVQSQIENETIYKRAVERILEKSHKNIDLTPIPKKRNLKNNIEKSIYFDAERTAVMLRKIEYSENLKSWKTDLIKQYSGHLFTELIIESQIIRIQRWWRKTLNYLFRKSPKIVKIQAVVQGYIFRLFCLSRIKSLIKFTHIDDYFRLRNAKMCLGIIAVNYARLFRRNFLKDKVNKIISLLRRFKNKKRRLLNSMAKIFTRHLIINARKSFRKIKTYDRASNCISKIQRAVRKMLTEKKLIKRYINSYDRRLNPLVPVYLWNRKKGFQTYMDKKRFLMGFCTTKFREALRRRRVKAFANILEYYIIKANKRLYLPTFFNRAKFQKTSFKKRKVQSAYLKKLLPKANNKNLLKLAFKHLRKQIWLQNLQQLLAQNLFSRVLRRFAFNPLVNELRFIRKLSKFKPIILKLVKLNQAKTFKALNTFSKTTAAKSKLLKQFISRKQSIKLGRAYEKWKNKSMFWKFYTKYNTKLIVLTDKLNKSIFQNKEACLRRIEYLYNFALKLEVVDRIMERTRDKNLLHGHQAIKKRCDENIKKDFKKKRILKKAFIKLFFTLKDKLLIYYLRWKTTTTLLNSGSNIDNMSKKVYQAYSENLARTLIKLTCLPFFNKIRLMRKYDNEERIKEVLEYRISKFKLHSNRQIAYKFHEWLNISKRIYFNSMIIRLQRVTRIYLLYIKMKSRALNRAHEDWENYLRELKHMKISLRNTICIITGFGVYEAFQRIKNQSHKNKIENSLKKMVVTINYRLRITFHKCFLNYKQLKSTIIDRYTQQQNNHVHSPNFKSRFILNFLKNRLRFLNKMKCKSDKVAVQKAFSKIRYVIVLNKVIRIQSKYRQISSKSKFICLKKSKSQLRSLFRNYAVRTIKSLCSIIRINKSIKRAAFRLLLSVLSFEADFKNCKLTTLQRLFEMISKKIQKSQRNLIRNLSEMNRLSHIQEKEKGQIEHQRSTQLRNLVFKKDKATYNLKFSAYFNWKLKSDANSVFLSTYTIKLYLKGYWIKRKFIDFCLRMHKLRFIKGFADLKKKKQLKRI